MDGVDILDAPVRTSPSRPTHPQRGWRPGTAGQRAPEGYLLALDQGTSSSRSIVFDEHGHIVA
ncbi:hypothetical protein C7Y68_03165, partial [Paracidovorax avenae]